MRAQQISHLMHSYARGDVIVQISLLLQSLILINKQSSITDRSHEKLELPWDQRKHSKVLVEVAKKEKHYPSGTTDTAKVFTR